MSSVTRPRGPLPPRVYWVRRLLVLVLAAGIVLGVARLLGGDPTAPADAAGSAAEPASSQTSARPTATATPQAQPSGGKRADEPSARKKKAKTPLAKPTGPCLDSDVRVIPKVAEDAYAGGDVLLTLRLRTRLSPACTWEVGPETLAVRLTSGKDRIWTSQECPASVPNQEVVLRDRTAATVEVTWSGRRSDPDCSRTTLWALPGYYHVSAAAMGAEPESRQFHLREPVAATITPSPKPKKKAADR